MRLREFIGEAGEVIDRPPVRQPTEQVPLHVPGGATVMILNDDVTPAEVVIEAVMYGTGLPQDEASRRVFRAHQGGWCPVASYASRDMAETVANKIETHARANTRWDRYRPLIPFNEPWPLTAEVMDAEQ
jgi:ATP-dependent Clp protease adapter protein ClpS